jgi:hypothetical protein
VIRRLRYYASVKSLHTVYISDASSSEENKNTLESEVLRLSNQLKIHYTHEPHLKDRQAIGAMLKRVEEPYSAFTGDDISEDQLDLNQVPL